MSLQGVEDQQDTGISEDDNIYQATMQLAYFSLVQSCLEYVWDSVTWEPYLAKDWLQML